MDIHKITDEVVKEIETGRQLQTLLKKYIKYYLLCCSKDRENIREMKKKSKNILEDKKANAYKIILTKHFLEGGSERRNAITNLKEKSTLD